MGCREPIAFLLKILNIFQTFVGVAMILCSVLMLNQWNSHDHSLHPNYTQTLWTFTATFSSDFLIHDLPAPWFIYTFLGIGIIVSVVSCFGHIAAETTNGCCLCLYTTLVTFLILIEAAMVGDIFLNHHWEKDFPEDPTGEFETIKAFIKDNMDTCKWVGLGIVVIQVLSLLLATILRAMVSPTKSDYDSDDDYFLPRACNRQHLLRVDSSYAPVSNEKMFHPYRCMEQKKARDVIVGHC